MGGISGIGGQIALDADIHRYRFRGSAAKVNLALDAPPDFTSRVRCLVKEKHRTR